MKRLFICVVGLVIAVTAWSRTFNMKELGADPRGIESCTELINQTIEKASSEGGGLFISRRCLFDSHYPHEK